MKGIYRIENKINKKYYIGSTNNFINRWKDHLRYLKKNKHQNIYLQKAFNKYGKNNFTFNKIYICPDSISEQGLLDVEQIFLTEASYEKHKTYNICFEAGKPPSREGSGGYHLTEEHKKKLSMQKGWKHTNEAKKKMSKYKKGKSWEEIFGIEKTKLMKKEASKRMKGNTINPMKGKHLPKQWKENISKSLKGVCISEKCKQIVSQIKSKPVIQIDKSTGKTLKTYSSARAAELAMGKNNKSTGINNVCRGIQKTAYGFKWKYLEEKRGII